MPKPHQPLSQGLLAPGTAHCSSLPQDLTFAAAACLTTESLVQWKEMTPEQS